MNECEEMKVTCIEPDQQALVPLANIEYRISVHMQGTYREILAVGRCLVEAKEAGLVPHGQWEEWVRRNTGMSERQAQRLMQAARNVQTGSAMESLPISKIQVILSLPEPEREAMAEQAASEDMSLRELQEEVRRQQRKRGRTMNTNQEDSIRRARMEALADKQRSELPDVQAAALQAAIDAEDADTAAEIARAIRNRLLKDSDAEVALDRLGLQVPSGATFTAWLSFLRTLGEALVGSWAEYRQMLRDLPQQEGWPLAIQWPTAPGSEEDGERLHEQP